MMLGKTIDGICSLVMTINYYSFQKEKWSSTFLRCFRTQVYKYIASQPSKLHAAQRVKLGALFPIYYKASLISRDFLWKVVGVKLQCLIRIFKFKIEELDLDLAKSKFRHEDIVLIQ